jgi:hypothetical protein
MPRQDSFTLGQAPPMGNFSATEDQPRSLQIPLVPAGWHAAMGKVAPVVLKGLFAFFAIRGMWRFFLLVVWVPGVWRWTRDLAQDYLLARALMTGIDPNTPLSKIAEMLGLPSAFLPPHATPHAPFVGLLFWPLARTDYGSASVTWAMLTLAALVFAIGFLFELKNRRISAPLALLGAFALVCWEPLWLEIHYGQLMILELAILSGMLVALQRGRNRTAGFLLGFSLLIKPIVWPVLALLVIRRRWEMAVSTIATLAAGYALTVAVVGPAATVKFLTDTMLSVTAYYRDSVFNISISGVGWRFFEGSWLSGQITSLQTGHYDPLIDNPQIGQVLSIILPAAVLVATWWFTRGMPLDRVIGVAICAGIVVSPIAWTHYMVLCLIPLVQSMRRSPPTYVLQLAVVVALLGSTYMMWFDALAIFLADPRPYVNIYQTLAVLAVAALAVTSSSGSQLPPGSQPACTPCDPPQLRSACDPQ